MIPNNIPVNDDGTVIIDNDEAQLKDVKVEAKGELDNDEAQLGHIFRETCLAQAHLFIMAITMAILIIMFIMIIMIIMSLIIFIISSICILNES